MGRFYCVGLKSVIGSSVLCSGTQVNQAKYKSLIYKVQYKFLGWVGIYRGEIGPFNYHAFEATKATKAS